MSLLLMLLIQVNNAHPAFVELSRMQNYGWGELNATGDVSLCGNMFGADPFYIQEGMCCSA